MRSICVRVTALLVALPLVCLTAVSAHAAVHERPHVAPGASFTAHGAAQNESDVCLKGPLTYPKSGGPDRREGFDEVDLVSDIQGRAEATDSHLVNPWGMSAAPGGPI